MSHIIECWGFADGSDCPMKGQYVETFDHDAYNGQGYGTFTEDASSAMSFNSFSDAFEFWNMVSTVKPVREDGKPNKPMTAMSVAIKTVDDCRQGNATH